MLRWNIICMWSREIVDPRSLCCPESVLGMRMRIRVQEHGNLPKFTYKSDILPFIIVFVPWQRPCSLIVPSLSNFLLNIPVAAFVVFLTDKMIERGRIVQFLFRGCLLIVPSLSRERIGEARDELMRMLAEDELREAVLLIFANKQDLPNAMNAAEITDKLGLHSLRNRNWYIQVSRSTVLPVLRIHDILGVDPDPRIHVLTNGSGSCYFRH